MERKNSALILVDLQNDFCQNGHLEVPGGDEIIPLANQLQSHFQWIIATKDWHPANHMSFAANHPEKQIGDVIIANDLEQVLWPTHCVQNTDGAKFHPKLKTSTINKVFFKGIDCSVDSYSAFFDNAHLRTTGLADYLLSKDIQNIYIMGLAIEYCVRFSCLDAVNLGFKTHIIVDACRGVGRQSEDIQRILIEMENAGVILVNSQEILAQN